jgi:hypothetical protein
MGVFDDKKYEELDWISKAVEPVEANIAKLLSELPDQYVFDYSTFLKVAGDNYRLSLNTRRALLHAASAEGKRVEYDDLVLLEGCYELAVSPNTLINFETETLEGEIKLIKVKNTFDDEELKNMLGFKGIRELSSIIYSNMTVSHVHEVAELLGKCEHITKFRSKRKKIIILKNRVKEIFANNEWNIKDVELANKMCTWIAMYITKGNMAAYTNFCKLKVMTHKGLPIYSMEEEPV